MTKASQRLGRQREACFFLTKASASAGMISFVFDDAFMPSDPSYVPNVLFIPHVLLVLVFLLIYRQQFSTLSGVSSHHKEKM